MVRARVLDELVSGEPVETRVVELRRVRVGGLSECEAEDDAKAGVDDAKERRGPCWS